VRRAAAIAATAALALSLAGCGGGGGSNTGVGVGADPGTTFPNADVFVVTTDFQTGSFATFPLTDPTNVRRNIDEIHSDAVARAHGGRVYIVNRLGGDNIQALDPAAGFATRWQCSVGNGANPHDIVFAAPNKAYVTLYERKSIAIVDPTTGPNCAGFLRGTIDLSAFGDVDGVPEMDQGIIIGRRLYVTVERLNRFEFFEPTDSSMVVVIDIDTDTIVDVDPSTPALDGIRLTATNPFSGSHGLARDPTNGKILVGQVGDFAVIGDGGIERVNPVTNRAEGLFVTETALGGNITDFVVVGARHAYALLFRANGENALVRFDPVAGTVTRTLVSSRDFLVDLELDPSGTLLLLTDRTLLRPGMRLFRVADDSEVTAVPIDTGLPPFDVVFLGEGAGGPVPIPAGFYVGETSEHEDMSLDIAALGTVFFTCGDRRVQGNPGGTIDEAGNFAVRIGGIDVVGHFGPANTIHGTLKGADCDACFSATLRTGATDSDGDRVPDEVDPDFGAVCGDGVPQGDEQCDDGNASNRDACLASCRHGICGDGFVRTGTEECDGGDGPCGPSEVCATDCTCQPPGQPCTSTTVTVNLQTPEVIGSATLELDYPEADVAIPGSGGVQSVRDRVAILTSAELFSGGSPNDLDDRIAFTLFASEGVGGGPLLAVTFDCLGLPPAPGTFACEVDAAASPDLDPIAGAGCTVSVSTQE
jgi:cysteine-rich repeat protein